MAILRVVTLYEVVEVGALERVFLEREMQVGAQVVNPELMRPRLFLRGFAIEENRKFVFTPCALEIPVGIRLCIIVHWEDKAKSQSGLHLSNGVKISSPAVSIPGWRASRLPGLWPSGRPFLYLSANRPPGIARP